MVEEAISSTHYLRASPTASPFHSLSQNLAILTKKLTPTVSLTGWLWPKLSLH
jgi:hypothetical protein